MLASKIRLAFSKEIAASSFSWRKSLKIKVEKILVDNRIEYGL